MKKFLLMVIMVIMLMFMMVSTLTATEAEARYNERRAIKETALNYIEGWYGANGNRMAAALHPELTKYGYRYYTADGNRVLASTNRSALVELARVGAGSGYPTKEWDIKVRILNKRENMASVLVNSVNFIDYLLMAKVQGQWKIINVLYEPNQEESLTPTQTRIEKRAIKTTALDYFEGYYSGDPVRIGRALHPELTKIGYRTYADDGNRIFTPIGYTAMVELTRLGAGTGIPSDEWNIKFKLLHLRANIASAKLTSNHYIDYILLIKTNGQWKITNVLWEKP